MKESIENIIKKYTDYEVLVEEVDENLYKITFTANTQGEDVSYSHIIVVDPSNLESNILDTLNWISFLNYYELY